MPASWIILMVSAVAAGIASCTTLVARRRLAAVSAVGTSALLAGCLWAITGIIAWTGQALIGLAAILLCVGAIGGGFWLAATLVPAMTRLPRPRPIVVPDEGEPALIIVADGQPEDYRPSTTTQSFERLADSGVPLPPAVVRAFAYVSDRTRYRAAGGSAARPTVRAVTAKALTRLRDRGFTGPAYEAWLQGGPGVCDAIAAALNGGARRIALVLYDVAESYEYEIANREMATRECRSGEATFAQSPPLWTQDDLVGFVCDKVTAALPGDLRPTDGVVVAAVGQPPQWDHVHPQASEQRTFFCQRVRAALIDRGLDDSHVRSAWLDWHPPDVTEVVRHLAAVGCQRIIVVPATSVADTTEVTLDLATAVEQAGIDSGVQLTALGGWGDDEVVADVLARVAAETLAELETRRRPGDQ